MATTSTRPAPSARRIADLFLSVDDADLSEWSDWYPRAYDIAADLATLYGVSLDIAAGVIAAVSPLNSWGANVNLAGRILAAGGLTSGYLGVGLRKASAILGGADILATLRSAKISNFYLAILTRGDHDTAVVDRHAYDIAVGIRHSDVTRPRLTGKAYAEAAQAYADAAAIIADETGETFGAAVVQSVTWMAHRRQYWAAGAWDTIKAAA